MPKRRYIVFARFKGCLLQNRAASHPTTEYFINSKRNISRLEMREDVVFLLSVLLACRILKQYILHLLDTALHPMFSKVPCHH